MSFDWRILLVMPRIASLVMVLLMVVMASPVAACAANLTMTPTEMACCRAMHGHCDEMMSHPCCRSHLINRLSQEPATPGNVVQVVAPVARTVEFIFPDVAGHGVQLASLAAYHPSPHLRQLSTIILRI